MTDFRFCWFADYEDGKMARLETIDSGIPVNIFAEPDSDFSFREEEMCSVYIYGVGSEVSFYENEDAYAASESKMAPISMIPMGTFPIHEDDDFQESPHIIFTGKVVAVEKNPDAGEDDPNFCVLIETLEMEVEVFLRYEGEIMVGGILSGVAWLYGTLLKR